MVVVVVAVVAVVVVVVVVADDVVLVIATVILVDVVIDVLVVVTIVLVPIAGRGRLVSVGGRSPARLHERFEASGQFDLNDGSLRVLKRERILAGGLNRFGGLNLTLMVTGSLVEFQSLMSR